MRVTPKDFYQWDHNQRIALEGVSAGTEVHYSCPGVDGGPVLVAYDEDGIIYADVPNNFLTVAETIKVWIHIDDGNRGTTVYSASINVKPKVKPDDYVYTPTEVRRWETLAQQLKKIEESIVPRPEYEGQLLYVVDGALVPLRLGPGLSIRDGVLYISSTVVTNTAVLGAGVLGSMILGKE